MYGELGLQYLFTPHLGLGVRASAVASRAVSHFTEEGTAGPPSQRLTMDQIALQPLQIIGAFYF